MTTPLTDEEVLALLTYDERTWMPPKTETRPVPVAFREVLCRLAAERRARKEAEVKAQADFQTYVAGLSDLYAERDAERARAEKAEAERDAADKEIDAQHADITDLRVEVARLQAKGQAPPSRSTPR